MELNLKTTYCYWLFIFALSSICTVWYGSLPYLTFMGDDLNLIVKAQDGGYASSIAKAFTMVDAEKYRPVMALFYCIEIKLLGNNFINYICVNIVIQCINTALLAYVCWILSNNNYLILIVAGLTAIVSRFAYYNVLQVWGAMEGLGILFLLLLVINVVRAMQYGRVSNILWANAWFMILIFTAERFLVAGLFLLFAAFMVNPNYISRIQRTYLATIPMLIIAFNYFIKKKVLDVNFLVGTGGTHIKFEFVKFVSFVGSAIANLFGFNVGPDYLSGLNVMDTWIPGVLFGVGVTVVILSIFYYGFKSFRFGNVENSQNKILILLLLLLFSLIAAASITIRQEFRWLYSPYMVFLNGVEFNLF
ncbi:hypothetical protein OR1_02021 [Geobacter sp. OR-1]|uniref:hypothetical protein n=1 Tax=Geobacter sp. OR-1 TaxID=1266765 RepID=UPI000541B30A|nr:hypothetical protein [Geobacter sp. OR-1]GAM09741.1 hypothetical protein OR1_02021 [Geobacter sp. OR-1]